MHDLPCSFQTDEFKAVGVQVSPGEFKVESRVSDHTLRNSLISKMFSILDFEI